MFKVMYVDDEPSLLDLGKIFLEQSGYLQVDTVPTVELALEKLQRETYDGIISDYQMPGKDGLEFLKYIRSHNQDLPFILFTGRGREEIVIEALNSGADFYLQKGGEHKSQFVELEHKIKNAIDRKRTHDTLRESEQRMADIINFLPDATFAVNLENKVIAWNRNIEQMTGISSDVMLGTDGCSAATSIYGEDKLTLVDLILNKDTNIATQYPYLSRQGDQIISESYIPHLYGGKGAHVWLVASPLYDTHGSVIGAIEAIRDISQRKEAEEQLRRTNEDLHAAYEQLTAAEEELRANYEELSNGERELHRVKERYQSVVEDQNELICRFAPDGKLTFVNDAYCRYFGLSRAACLEQQHKVKIPPEDRTLVKQHIKSLTKESPVNSLVHRIILSTGKVRWQQWSDRAIFDANGRVIEYQSVGRDITRQKEAEDTLQRANEDLNAAYEQLTATEEELRQNYEELSKNQQELCRSEDRYRNIIEDQTEFICRFTPEGILTFVNEAYCQYFGKTKNELVGHHFSPEIPKEDCDKVKAHFSAITSDHPVNTIVHRIVLENGIHWQKWSDRATFDAQGQVIEYQSVGRDITQEKESADKLRYMNEDLHAAYEQLTATEEELRANYEELAKGERELHEVKERYQSVVEDQTELICRFTPEGVLTFVNDAYCRYFGMSKAEALEKRQLVTLPKEDGIKVKEHIRALTREKPVGTVEHRIIMPDGKIRWQQWSDRAIFDPDGKIIEYQSVGRDVTREKEAEAELQRTHEDLHAAYEQLTATEEELRANYEELAKGERELHEVKERYRSVVEDQTELICRFTPEGVLTFVNDAYCRYFGMSKAEALEKRQLVTLPKEDGIKVKEHIRALTREKPVGTVEHRIIMPDGKIRWQQWSDRAIFDPDGRIIEYQSVGRDTTRQKEADEELQRTHEDLHAAYEQLTATEEELRQNYDELSKNQEELYRSEERYRNIIEDQTEFICRFTPAGELTFVNDAYCQYFGKKREELIGHHFSPAIPEEDRDIVKAHFSSVSRDRPIKIIEHRIIMPGGQIRWQQWSDRAIFDSAGGIIEYQSVGRDITERKRMERALHESNQKLNLLSSITRHDILNQLTALGGYHTLLDESVMDKEHRGWIKGAIKAGETIRSQILFTQQYQDIGVQNPRWQDIFACANAVSKEHGFSNISIDPALNRIEVFADPLLKTVFYNLFENAMMHGETVRNIRVTGNRADAAFRIIVEDDGNGIDTALKEKIFQKGFGNHTGLGLFLVREVLAITGLTIRETGEPGKGARFEILVPKDTFRTIAQPA